MARAAAPRSVVAPKALVATAAERASEPPLPPVPVRPFADQTTVTVAELVAELDAAAQSIARTRAVRSDYEELLANHRLTDSDDLYREYLAVRVVFEATRDGGLWGIVWDITNQIGHSDLIWKQWQQATVPPPRSWGITAVAECDELSALYAYLVNHLGVEHAGFLGGGPMHIVGHWTFRTESRREVRIVVPTSQVFLTPQATLGTREINAYSARKVWDYWRPDVPLGYTIPADLARHFVEQLPLTALPSAELQRRRNEHGGS